MQALSMLGEERSLTFKTFPHSVRKYKKQQQTLQHHLCGLYLPSKKEGSLQNVPLKCWNLPISPHSITTQKTNINIFTAVRTSNLMILSSLMQK
jgi:hypothetical protein